VPFCPLGWPRDQHDAILANPVVTAIARAHTATPAQVALAWLLAQSANVLLIAGTTSRRHLLENLAVGTLSLNSNELAELDAQIDVFEQSESAR
jgi:aryl-alcohol dehydrogenase-like predicted oxidoreductase